MPVQISKACMNCLFPGTVRWGRSFPKNHGSYDWLFTWTVNCSNSWSFPRMPGFTFRLFARTVNCATLGFALKDWGRNPNHETKHTVLSRGTFIQSYKTSQILLKSIRMPSIVRLEVIWEFSSQLTSCLPLVREERSAPVWDQGGGSPPCWTTGGSAAAWGGQTILIARHY